MSQNPSASPRRRVSVVQVLGEVLVTLGVIVGLYLAWQIWFNNSISTSLQSAEADSLSQQWDLAPSGPAAEPTESLEPVVAEPADPDEIFANLIVPRWGSDYRRPIAEGVGYSVLNNVSRGMGHYPSTQMPGEVGNFALASHRSAYGGAFHTIQDLRVGDALYVETQDGWYEYRYRNTEYVLPDAIGAIAPVPLSADVDPTDRLITLTTCNPLYSTAERVIAYGVLTEFYPRAGGPPAELETGD